jgi:hypothetical protein
MSIQKNLAHRFDCFNHSFSAETFATQSALSGHVAMSDLSPLSGANRTLKLLHLDETRVPIVAAWVWDAI